MFEDIRIVLINTSHPGNIGSAARAMKTMGLTDLVLVDPQKFDPASPPEVAVSMATGALDIMSSARVVSTFEEAVSDVAIVMLSLIHISEPTRPY